MIEKNTFKKQFLGRVFVHLFIVIAAFWIILPFVWMLLSSLKTSVQVNDIPPTIFPNPITIVGYLDSFEYWNIVRLLGNSLFVSTTITIVCLFFSSLAGYAFAHLYCPGKNILFIIIISSLLLPFQIRMIPTYLLITRLGMFDTYYALIIPWLATGFSVFFMRQMMFGIPTSLLEAARVEGCSEFRIYWSIIIPNIKPALASLGILVFLNSWNEFIWPLIMINSDSKKTLPLIVASMTTGGAGGSSNLFSFGWNMKMAGLTIIIVPVIICFLMLQKKMMEAMTLQAGMKE